MSETVAQSSAGTADLKIPDLGDGIDEGVIISMLVNVGDSLRADQPVLEIETDKVTVEVPASRNGTIDAIFVEVDQTVKPGDLVMRLTVDDEESSAAVTPIAASAVPETPPVESSIDRKQAPSATPVAPLNTGKTIAAGPSARREARELGVDLSRIVDAGHQGRITRDDVRDHVRSKHHAAGAGRSEKGGRQLPRVLPDLAAFGEIRRERLSRIERVTASNLARSTAIVPHAWLERKVDITELEAARRRFRERQPPATPGLTVTAILCRAIATLLSELPRFNAAFDDVDNEIVYRDYINVGIAVDTERGLVVPVVRGADQLDLMQTVSAIAELSAGARENSLDASALRGAGFTISNLGGLGVSGIQPIVNWPEAAILGVAAAAPQLSQVDGQIVTRQLLPLTLGFDHRLINGADAARFLARLDETLAYPLELFA